MGHIHGIVIDMPKNGGNRMASWKIHGNEGFFGEHIQMGWLHNWL